MLMTVKLRRDDNFQVKPEAEQLDGKTFAFSSGWDITEDDSGIYVGEIAMIPRDESYPTDAPLWIASGDLIAA
jgi:hypothetical protein